jgi:hypothetical protein
MNKQVQNEGIQLSARNFCNLVESQNRISQPYLQFDQEEIIAVNWKPRRQELMILGTMAALGFKLL